MPTLKHPLRTAIAALVLALAGVLPPAPVSEAVEPAAELTAEPAVEPAAEPAAEPTAEPAVESAAALPPGFRDELVIGGLERPTIVQFAPDGRIVVGEKRGRIRIYQSPADSSPGVYTGLETNVFDNFDRGLLGLALDPAFTTGRPYVYVSYTYNHILGDPNPAPRWTGDICPLPPGTTTDGCVVSGRVSRLTVTNKTIVAGSEKPLVEDWCQQFPSHSMGALAFGPEGALYATGGEGASFLLEQDYGQLGGSLEGTPTPANPCGDPPNPKGTPNEPPEAEGGSLRAQDIRTTGDPDGLNGALIRIDPNTGAAWPNNARVIAGDDDPNGRRIVAYGLRNPFRFAVRPGSSEVWLGDVGSFWWEEIDEVPNPNAAPRNFGWPCYEGNARNGGWDALNVDLCETLYDDSPITVTHHAFGYHHGIDFVAGDGCGTGSSAISGLAFLGTTSGYPNVYDRGLFVTDYVRRCIWWFPADSSGRPNFAQAARFADLRAVGTNDGAVSLTTAPNGDLVYAAHDRGEIRRIHWYAGVPPTASFTASPSSGPLPLTVTFDASGTTNPNPVDPLTYEWDLDGDGAYDDATGKIVSRTYTTKAQVVVGLRVTDTFPRIDTTSRTISPGYVAPSVTMVTPASSLKWAVGESVAFSGTATDGNGTSLPASSMTWAVNIEHCPSNCHSHPPFFTFTGASGSFPAPDHDYPSHLRVVLTVTDGPLSTSVTREIFPRTGIIRVRSDPPALPVSLAGKTGAPPPDATAIVGSAVSVAAPLSATLGITQYQFDGWSDGGAAVHGVVAGAGTTTLTARYRAVGPVTEYRALDPARILDTRVGNGLTGPFQANTARTFQVTGRGGVPADAVAVTGNLTVTRQTGGGHVAITPMPTNHPPASNLNFPVGVDRASVVTATLGPGGKLSAVYVAGAGKTTHLVFDVTGYFTASGSGGTYRPIDPARFLDTRTGNGLSGPFVVGERRRWDVAGRGGIPANATAITGNLTVVNPSAAGYVTLLPAGAPRTATSTLNFRAGEVAANGVAIRLGLDGRLSAVVGGPAGATTHLVLDVTGYFLDDDGGARYVPLYPGRRLDTRTGLGLAGRFQANVGRTLAVAGHLGVPPGAVAINGTLTVTGATARGHLTLLRTAANTTSTSTLNFVAGESRANGFFGRLSTGGSVGILFVAPAGATTDVVLDIAGYFR